MVTRGEKEAMMSSPVVVRLSVDNIPPDQTGEETVKNMFHTTALKNLSHQELVQLRIKPGSAPRFPYNIYSEFEVSGWQVHRELWLKEVSTVLKESCLPLWISPENSVFGESRHAVHPDIVLTEFSFGSFLHPKTFLCYYSSGSAQAKICFQYDCKQCFLYCSIPAELPYVMRLELRLNRDVKQEIVVETSKNAVNIYVFLILAPRLTKAENLCIGTKRVIATVDNVDGEEYEFSFSRLNEFQDCSTDIIGGSNCLKLQIPSYGPWTEVLRGLQSIGFRIYFGSVNTEKAVPVEDKLCELSRLCGLNNYDVIWALKTVLSRGLYVPETLYRDKQHFVHVMQKYNEENAAELENILHRIADMLEMGILLDVRKAIEDLKESKSTRTEIVAPGTRRVRRVVLTPTKQLFLPPQLMFENRILRDYNEDYCLRVSFRDDNMQKLSGVRPTDTKFFEAVVKKPLQLGIRVDNRHYELLACSNSQLRDHGVWFYAKDTTGNTASSIRDSMGNLSGIDCVASYVARMGQCFSTTEDSLHVPVDYKSVKVDEDDITQGKYTFSDGTGRISDSLAQKVSEAIGRKKVHSVYQIRYGGCKGTVCLDPTLEGDALLIRKSMNKFHSDHQRLEIAKVSQPCSLFLNHSAIMLLDDLGVPTSVFLQLQDNMLKDLVYMLLVDTKAAEMLGRQTSLPIKFKSIVNCGMSLIRDPLFKQMLHAVLAYRLQDIQNKARISLPESHARNMLGAMDETGTLKYGQVFIQYTKDIKSERNSTSVLTGDVIVTKFPALHQGDIRRFVAVDIPELHHMVDCIVFPSQGPRPHPNEMAGSDLDGDEYFVTWLPEFLEHFPKQNERPMAFPPATKVRLGRPVKIDDIIEFVKDYMRNDRLGLISNAHKAHADEHNIFATVCQTLAKKHSEAVDFAKTGYCPELDKGERVRVYPDFMGKHGLNCVRKSRKALGKLYRACRHVTNLIPRGEERTPGNKTLDETWNNVHQLARRLNVHTTYQSVYISYKSAVREMMNRYGIESEAELLSGCIRRLHLRLTQRHDMFETIKIISLQTQELVKTFRKEFFEEFGGEGRYDVSNPTDRMLAKAAAWHFLSYNDQNEPALSFPWVVWDVLCKCYSQEMCEIPRWKSTSVLDDITQQIYQIYRQGLQNSELPVQDQFVLQHVNSHPWLAPVLHVILTWVSNEGIAVECNDQRMVVSSLFIKFAINKPETSAAHLLLSIFRYFGSQSDFNTVTADARVSSALLQNLQRSAQKAYFVLAITGNLYKLLDESLTEQPEECNVVIETGIWKYIRGYCPSIENACKAVFGRKLSNVTLRRRRSGRYADGLLWAKGNGSVVSKLEDMFSISSPTNLFRTDCEYLFRRILDRM